MYLARKYWLGTLFRLLHSPFDVVIKATGPAAHRSKKVPLFLTKTLSVDLPPPPPGESTPWPPTLQSSALPIKLILPRLLHYKLIL